MGDTDITICAKCTHFISIEDGPRTGIWYNLYCGASEREEAIDPVTGKIGYLSVNSLGGEYLDDMKFEHCRDINQGDCPKYESCAD